MARPTILDNLRRSLIPDAQFTITTRLAPAKVLQRMRKITQPFAPSLMNEVPKSDRPYHGEVTRHGFVIWRTKPADRKPVLRIEGHIQDDTDLTKIDVVVEIDSLNKYLGILIYCLTGIIFLVTLGINISATVSGSVTPVGLLFYSVLFALPFLLTTGWYNVNFGPAVSVIKLDFEELLEDIERGQVDQ